MPKLTIVINVHGEKYTVREMRRRLAEVLSKLNGTQECSFTFRATLDQYQPIPPLEPIFVIGPLAAPSND